MNFLALAQKLVEKCGISGTGPVTVLNQSGELKRAVNWINEAWVSIQQTREDWDWMRGSVSFSTVAQQGSYTPAQCGITDLAEWYLNSRYCSFRTYDTTVGVRSEIYMSQIDYDTYRDIYLYGSMRLSYARPLSIAVAPDMSLCFGQIPDSSNYTIVGDYFKTPTEMVNDTDIPGLPTRFHMVIVYQAMIYYGEYEQDEYVRQMAETNYRKMMGNMTVAQLPEMTMGPALA